MKDVEVITVDCGDEVICDYCDECYTDSNEEGGFLFGGYAVCPKCADKSLQNIRKYNEEDRIKAVCPAGWSFARFVRELCR